MKDATKWMIFLLLTAMTGCGTMTKKTVKEKKKSAIIYRYGSQRLMEGHYTTALENLIKADAMDPRNPEIMNNLALAYFYKNRPATAKKILQDLIKIAPNHSDALNNLGTIYMKEGNLNLAEKYFRKVSEHLLFKKQFLISHNLSKIAFKKGQIELSRLHNTASLEKFDRFCPALFHRGFLFYKEKKWNEADESFKKAMKGTCYTYHGSHFYRALSLKRLGRLGLAEQILESLKTSFPKNTYMAKVKLELQEIRKIKNSPNYLKRQNLFKVPQF
ncbi:MAG: tetratricopeptide repeat protein [Bacteriovoracales bacterium]|nr:tetratricopeptide repeat protein [Bacteriovoracales bacterium]